MRDETILLRDADDIFAFYHNATGMQPGYTQFSRGPANLECRSVDLDGVLLIWTTSRAHARWRDQMADNGALHFAFMLAAEDSAKARGQDIGPNNAMVWMPGEEMDYLFKGKLTTLEIGVSREIVEALGWSFSGPALANVPGGILAALARRCHQITADLAGAKGAIAPSVVAHAREQVLAALEDALLPWFADGQDLTRSDSPIAPHYRIIQRTDRLLDRLEDGVTTASALADALGVPRRTVFYAFRRSLGIGPRRYLEVQRLYRLRGRLKDADPARDTVTDLAIELDFGDLGRLASRYRQQFGEYPSVTLKSYPN